MQINNLTKNQKLKMKKDVQLLNAISMLQNNNINS